MTMMYEADRCTMKRCSILKTFQEAVLDPYVVFVAHRGAVKAEEQVLEMQKW
jgi:hypothetical protein